MKRHINNPYKVNWKMYGLIGGISVLIMIISVVQNNLTSNSISDIAKNLAFGCVASTLVALLIEIGNVKEKNEKANNVYDAVYNELQYQIGWYVELWASLCAVAYKDKDYYHESHTWSEWYKITRENFQKCDEHRQKELMTFFNQELVFSVDGIEKSLKRIDNQQYILNINEISDESLRRILKDYRFEFDAAKLTLESDYTKNDFWGTFDAITQDLINYIYNWVDIRYYNYYRFKPYEFCDNTAELLRAIQESDKSHK